MNHFLMFSLYLALFLTLQRPVASESVKRQLQTPGCDADFCHQNGDCFVDLITSSPACICHSGYTGSFCETEVTCEDAPCQNGGSCLQARSHYLCHCHLGFNGVDCEQKTPFSNRCRNTVCLHGGVCQRDVAGRETCQCQPRFTGAACEQLKPDPCAHGRCQNGAVCVVDSNFDDYACSCAAPYHGSFCELKMDLLDTSKPSLFNCHTDNPCVGGDCVTDPDTSESHCRCRSGFAGLFCEQNKDECAVNQCQNDGICVDLFNGFSCHCPAEYFGDLCQFEVSSPCHLQPCQNRGLCTISDQYGAYSCQCDAGFSGPHCEEHAPAVFEDYLDDLADPHAHTPIQTSTNFFLEDADTSSFVVSHATDDVFTPQESEDYYTDVEAAETTTTTTTTAPDLSSGGTRTCPEHCRLKENDSICDIICNNSVCAYDFGDCLSHAIFSEDYSDLDTEQTAVKAPEVIEIELEIDPVLFTREAAGKVLEKLMHVTQTHVMYDVSRSNRFRVYAWNQHSGLETLLSLDPAAPSDVFGGGLDVWGVKIYVVIDREACKHEDCRFSDEAALMDCVTHLDKNELISVFGGEMRRSRIIAGPGHGDTDDSNLARHVFLVVGAVLGLALLTALLTQFRRQRSKLARTRNTVWTTGVYWPGDDVEKHASLTAFKDTPLDSPLPSKDAHHDWMDASFEHLDPDYFVDSINGLDAEGEPALYAAVKTNNLHAVRFILKVKSVDVNASVGANDNALKKCCRLGPSHLELLHLLAEHPQIDFNAVGDRRERGCDWRSPLHVAAACGHLEIVQFLVQHGASVTAKDTRLQSPLFAAIDNNQVQVAEYLVEQMAPHDLILEDENGATALELAKTRNLDSVVQQIVQKRAVFEGNQENVPVAPQNNSNLTPANHFNQFPQQQGLISNQIFDYSIQTMMPVQTRPILSDYSVNSEEPRHLRVLHQHPQMGFDQARYVAENPQRLMPRTNPQSSIRHKRKGSILETPQLEPQQLHSHNYHDHSSHPKRYRQQPQHTQLVQNNYIYHQKTSSYTQQPCFDIYSHNPQPPQLSGHQIPQNYSNYHQNLQMYGQPGPYPSGAVRGTPNYLNDHSDSSGYYSASNLSHAEEYTSKMSRTRVFSQFQYDEVQQSVLQMGAFN